MKSRSVSYTDNHLPIDDFRFSSELIKRFRAAFFAAYRSPFGIQRIDRPWITETRPDRYLTDVKTMKHLRGDYYIGPASRSMTKGLTIDLDDHDGQGRKCLLERAEAVRNAFPEAVPLCFSTPRRGTHIDYLFPSPVWSKKARAFAENRLAKMGLQVKPGHVEIFPHGKKILRAPLGRNCFMLHPDTLEPIGSRWESIEELDRVLKCDEVVRLEVPPEFDSDLVLSRTGSVRHQRRYNDNNISPFMWEIDMLLVFGLQTKGTRNTALLKLSWYYQAVEGLDAETTVRTLIRWVDQKNNGHSRHYNANPAGVYSHIRQLVDRFDSSKIASRDVVRRNETRVSFDVARRFTQELAMTDSSRDLLAHLIEYALKRGMKNRFGCYEVRVPSRTLQDWNREYGPALRNLIRKGHIAKARGYSTLGFSQEYEIRTFPCN